MKEFLIFILGMVGILAFIFSLVVLSDYFTSLLCAFRILVIPRRKSWRKEFIFISKGINCIDEIYGEPTWLRRIVENRANESMLHFGIAGRAEVSHLSGPDNPIVTLVVRDHHNVTEYDIFNKQIITFDWKAYRKVPTNWPE